uniref:Uncharacterized protein n=1 Tax=Arundo donax TaxID=35708 RepID=A0A0A8ZHN9_ARUDO
MCAHLETLGSETALVHLSRCMHVCLCPSCVLFRHRS